MASKINKNISAKSGNLKGSGSLKKSKKNEFNQEQTIKTRVSRAKKMVLRKPNKEIVQATERLKKIRSDVNEPVRLQKALAMSGVGSRRSAEELIARGSGYRHPAAGRGDEAVSVQRQHRGERGVRRRRMEA